MIIAVMSDSHDHLENLRHALNLIKKENARHIIHCGDFVAPFVLKELQAAGIPVNGVFGNNDGDQYLLTHAALNSGGLIRLDSLIGEITLDGLHIAYTHQWPVAEGLAATGKYHLVCFGHSHTFFKDQTDDTLILNPGEIMGKDGDPGFCLVDTETRKIRRISLQ